MKYKAITLKAPKNAEYTSVKLKFEIIEDINKFVNNLLKKQDIIFAEKTAPVEYVICKQNNKKITTNSTVLYNKKLYSIFETKNYASVGDFIIIKNAGLNRKYAMHINTALIRYAFNPKQPSGVAAPIPRLEKFIKVDKNIVFTSPWNEQMCLLKGGYLNITGHRYYAIQQYAFKLTYKIVKQP